MVGLVGCVGGCRVAGAAGEAWAIGPQGHMATEATEVS